MGEAVLADRGDPEAVTVAVAVDGRPGAKVGARA